MLLETNVKFSDKWKILDSFQSKVSDTGLINCMPRHDPAVRNYKPATMLLNERPMATYRTTHEPPNAK